MRDRKVGLPRLTAWLNVQRHFFDPFTAAEIPLGKSAGKVLTGRYTTLAKSAVRPELAKADSLTTGTMVPKWL